jgi:SNF2 family DNA or RNA helicase
MINKLMKLIIISTVSTVMTFPSLHAEKIECDLLSPIQKKIYQAYCKSVERQATANKAAGTDTKGETITKTKSILKKVLGNLNTDSTLVDKMKGEKK